MVVHCEQTVEECYCSDNPLPVKLTLNKTAYAPGENLMYEIDIFNKSYREIQLIYIKLQKVNNEHVIYTVKVIMNTSYTLLR